MLIKRERKPKRQYRLDSPETLANWTHKTQDEDKHSTKTQHRKLKR